MYILASASPRRKELLRTVIDEFSIIPSEVEEVVPAELVPAKQPEFLSRLKAEDIALKYPKATVIGADTSVIIGERVMGKPKDKKDAKEMLELLSGNTHSVITGCCIICGEKSVSFSVETKVTFYELSEQEINEYLQTGEPYDKAGAYGIQGKGALLVKEISGDYFNVVGLPIAELSRHLF